MLEWYQEALNDKGSGLTYPALTAAWKLSISDAERLFSASLSQWFHQKGYLQEAQYTEIIHNWHRAVDERG